MSLSLILHEVLEEKQRKCHFHEVLEEGQRKCGSGISILMTPSRLEGESQIHVWFTVIFPSGILSCIALRLEG